ncbi:coiled-coil domain-containing protein 130 [Ixodes scapularis]|uniref:coiled-coil domain-containing protein 130 n=1 Tax=Ixodes scapularis TaxID=6945 RepID=UPI001A9FD9E3|nr:coiled-coil domain-containing protein 130 [Ixodes scapularis]
MAERKAVNKYYPPEWTPGHGSINKFRNSHPLRDRARKLHLGILVIRFEMPYNIWCDGCGNHIGTGVRYNAEKSKVGMYYSTPVYKFRMKCHLCDNHFEIKTDPQNMDYEIVCGARRQERRWDPTENEQVAPDDKEVGKKLATDAMFKLEHGEDDKAKVKIATPSLARLEHLQDRWRDDYTANQLLRKGFRTKKKELQLQAEKDRALLAKSSLQISLVPEASEDGRIAKLLALMPTHTSDERQRLKRTEITERPLFPPSSAQHPRAKAPTEKTGSALSGLVKHPKKPNPVDETEPSVSKEPSSTNCSLVSVDYCNESSDEET